MIFDEFFSAGLYQNLEILTKNCSDAYRNFPLEVFETYIKT